MSNKNRLRTLIVGVLIIAVLIAVSKYKWGKGGVDVPNVTSGIAVKTATPVAVTIETATPVVVTMTPEPTEDPNMDTEVITYNKKRLKRTLKKYKHIKITEKQVLSTIDIRTRDYAKIVERNITIDYDTKNKVSKLYSSSDSDHLGKSSADLISDFKNNKHYTRKNGKKWVRNKSKTYVLNIDNKKVSSAYDIYKSIVGVDILKKGYKGIISKDTECYTLIKKATKEDVGVDNVDEFLNKIIVVIVKKNIPSSVEQIISYKKHGTIYTEATKVKVSGVNNKKLSTKEVKNKKG